ncbi:MAG: MGMT family protein [Clostridia bacterium]|nr:MGMT family protein [Clostridia bacterium]
MDEYSLRVYEIVARIPRGKVATYAQIASLLGNPQAARRVGRAMSHAPDGMDLPCHRVVNAKGEMLPDRTFGGPEAQRARLSREGVAFRPNGNIDLKQSLWMFE